MNKLQKAKQVLALIAGLSFVSAASAAPTVVPAPPTVAAKAFVLMDYNSGKILAENNAYELLHPASLTKMMTSYVIGQEMVAGNIHDDDMVTISENAWAKNFPDSSKMFIEVGKQVSVADLNRGIIIQSGNDACVAMAEHIAGTEEGFTDLMNSWAKQLGMVDSHFVNSHGLDSDEHKTTAYDMALLGRALIRDVPLEYEIYAHKSFTFNGIKQFNRNGLLWDKSMNVDGIKTGHTSKAGFSLVTSAVKDNMRLVAVVMGTRSDAARKAESKKLLNYGFRFYESVTPYQAGDSFTEQRIWYGDQKQIKLGVDQDTAFTLYRGQSKKLKANFELTKELKAPIAAGEVVGKVYFQVDGNDVAEFPLVTLEAVEQGGLIDRIMDYFRELFAKWFN
ncbi:D-alanyl-D-alanine carboxypeptidase family protein [Paraferrimonas haliotis]|uniref:serine-type D-Ala-D-Ala carboxypeptidase n=1 Tax=Paraferrimonas haliotis TaxID=2013866 RepID=A0AA37TSV3_9GAMM|nr:D-alanyl-D-alanine carboxypeptidase family protein [Paraferrimonas haliotis]GLS83562.1 D-alanyl-D-alanine carboxypeptidase [Paraferrimonas haliotis]